MNGILVTGAGKGIGRAIVERLLSERRPIIGVSRSKGDLEQLESLAARLRVPARFFQADVSRPNDVESIAREVRARGVKLSALVNNVGQFHAGALLEMAPEALTDLWRNNVLSSFLMTQAFLPELMSSKGHIVNIISIAAQRPLSGKTAYCSSKAAQAMLFRGLRDELREKGVKVSNLYPGITFTCSFKDEDVDPAKMMAAADVAQAVAQVLNTTGNCTLEELVLQPSEGMFL